MKGLNEFNLEWKNTSFDVTLILVNSNYSVVYRRRPSLHTQSKVSYVIVSEQKQSEFDFLIKF